MSLATKYRPTEFNEVCGQQSIVNILNRQVDLRNYSNCYLLSGPSGCGKTTIARIFARKINNNCGNPIELDAASNNGVNNVREIIASAKERSLDSEYKVFIIDECHMITKEGWNAFLKCIEEPPKYTIFIFCTTDPQKIPETILNRVMKFTLSKVPDILISNRLMYICSKEGIDIDNESVQYITKISNGGMRDAIASLDKVYQYTKSITMNTTLSMLGLYSYDSMFDLTNAIVDGNKAGIIEIMNNLNSNGTDLKVFVDSYIDFLLELNKYVLLGAKAVIELPGNYVSADGSNPHSVKYATGFEGSSKYFTDLVSKMLDAKLIIRNDSAIKNTLTVLLLRMCGD